MIGLGPLCESELAPAILLLARAFRDNPLNCAVIRSRRPERRQRVNAHGLRALLPVAQKRGRVLAARADSDVVGAVISIPPFAYPLPPPSAVPRLRCLAGQGLRVSIRWAQAFHALDEAHPLEPHWYLSTLGVDPCRQGQGFGSALLRAWLRDVDLESEPAYLETDREENMAFYVREGFEPIGELSVLGTRVWSLWRTARP